MDNEIKRIETTITRTSGRNGYPSVTTHRKVRFVFRGVEYKTRKEAEKAKALHKLHDMWAQTYDRQQTALTGRTS